MPTDCVSQVEVSTIEAHRVTQGTKRDAWGILEGVVAAARHCAPAGSGLVLCKKQHVLWKGNSLGLPMLPDGICC